MANTNSSATDLLKHPLLVALVVAILTGTFGWFAIIKDSQGDIKLLQDKVASIDLIQQDINVLKSNINGINDVERRTTILENSLEQTKASLSKLEIGNAVVLNEITSIKQGTSEYRRIQQDMYRVLLEIQQNGSAG